jgi:nitronate monooxygenase
MITTELTKRLGIEHPIIQAGMASECGWQIAAAVSNAGALGSIGGIGRSPQGFAEEIRLCRAATQKPFAVNVVTFDWSPFAEALVEVAIAERPPVVTLSFGDTIPALRRCRDAGLVTFVQAQDFAGAKAALDAGADAVIVQGAEAGGHTGSRGTLSFAAQVLEIAGGTPVVIAGGVGNGRGLAAALAMGAAGVTMGTRFKATVEFGPAMRWGEEQKAAIVASDGANTVRDVITDIPLPMTWPDGVVGRAMANRFTREWLGRADALAQAVRAAGAPGAFVGQLGGAPDTITNWAGESAGLVHGVVPAAQVVIETVEEAEALLRTVAANLVPRSS